MIKSYELNFKNEKGRMVFYHSPVKCKDDLIAHLRNSKPKRKNKK